MDFSPAALDSIPTGVVIAQGIAFKPVKTAFEMPPCISHPLVAITGDDGYILAIGVSGGSPTLDETYDMAGSDGFMKIGTTFTFITATYTDTGAGPSLSSGKVAFGKFTPELGSTMSVAFDLMFGEDVHVAGTVSGAFATMPGC